MTPVDLVLLLILLVALGAGLSRGLLATLGGLAGLIAGGLAAFWAVPAVNDLLPSSQWRGPVAVAVAIALPVLGASLGSGLGHDLRRGVDRTALRPLERLLGGAANVVVAALALSFVGNAITATGTPGVAAALSSSSVLRTIDDLTPPAVGRPLAEMRAMALDDGLPRLNLLIVPRQAPVAPTVDLDDADLEAAARSVARISGIAYACGKSSTGSGFVVAPDRVVTNAHVVAGVDRPVVELPDSPAREGRVVYFDPVDDLAVVAVDGLSADALDIAPTLSVGDRAVVQGYPYGGPFTSTSAGVLGVDTARVPDVYGSGAAGREVYSLAAAVRPGNSGGPLLTTGGDVAGVVFARADSSADVGYAMTSAELRPVAAQATELDAAVSSGQCTA
ncbi:MarP family serine protease [Myceligenerans pegani]|uniref:MarP family serine protease n=1 Tax=Myceligenerans pegani TaxID=2776917 RepID=A0ABR9MSM8_9MICO|nr:MarP family serine protease [Myceligenerans sp. TRM 65318]MBE1874380.1 MarP family serine protease [Myceligenerans sp. TRM 65318]MBE3016651.1 MarP family serine protease [Myceligenerans sp. TRM 65318]